ncbi:MAG: hypothetical protein ABI968_01880 [Acidobacteriota bacterium]
MSGRKARNLLLLAIAAGIGYWIYKDRPTLSGMIDQITNPLLGSNAAVKSSERNRVNTDAGVVVSDQSESRVDALRKGMSKDDIVEMLGSPDLIQRDRTKPDEMRWTYRQARRFIVFQNNHVVSVSILDAAVAAP